MISWKKVRLFVLDYWHHLLVVLAVLAGIILLMYFSQVQMNARWQRLEEVRVDRVQFGRRASTETVGEVDQPVGDMLPPEVHFKLPQTDVLRMIEYWGSPIRDRGLRVPGIPLQSAPSLSGPPSP